MLHDLRCSTRHQWTGKTGFWYLFVPGSEHSREKIPHWHRQTSVPPSLGQSGRGSGKATRKGDPTAERGGGTTAATIGTSSGSQRTGQERQRQRLEAERQRLQSQQLESMDVSQLLKKARELQQKIDQVGPQVREEINRQIAAIPRAGKTSVVATTRWSCCPLIFEGPFSIGITLWRPKGKVKCFTSSTHPWILLFKCLWTNCQNLC